MPQRDKVAPCTPLYLIQAVCLLSELLYLWHASCWIPGSHISGLSWQILI